MKKTEVTAVIPEVYPVQMIDVNTIDPSPGNKRRFTASDDKSLIELGNNIEAQGLLQAIVVRGGTKRGRYELVAGERRWRAFGLKGWKKIPSIVRELTDAQAHDITVSENLQREDLSPIEESESIQVLLADGRDPKEIADRLGKPLSWVVRRARIAGLSEKWIKAISDPSHPLSKWSATHLELIARFETEKQDELFDDEYGEGYNTDTALMTVKYLEKALNEKLLSLSGAPWKPGDETLLPSAGACTQCQKRTSCTPSLFEPIEDIKSARGDRCIDRECWGKKLVAYHKLAIKKALDGNKNLILINKGGSSLPSDHPWKESLAESYKYEPAKKEDKTAVPAYIVDGPGAGKVKYVKLQGWCEKLAKARPIGEDGKPAPTSLEDRMKGLEKRRVIRFINKLMQILGGKDPDVVGAKHGVCRVCGCTEGNCTQCVEKTGSPCHWEDPDKTLCSACVDVVQNKDQRGKIAEGLSHIEVHSLVAAFGAGCAFYGNLKSLDSSINLSSYYGPWEIYKKVVQANGPDALRIAMYCAFERIVDALRQLTYSSEPDFDFANNLCLALKLDRETIWNKVVEELPEPKGWAKLQADGSPRAEKKTATKTISDMVGEPEAPAEEPKATRYNYKGNEIFVSAGIGGKEYGTFQISDGGSGIKRIISKKMPMVADKNEAQRNLDSFAKENFLKKVTEEE